MRRSFAVGVVAAVLAASAARAQETSPAGARATPSLPGLGGPGSVAVGVERLFGITHATGGGSSVTTVALLGPGGAEVGFAPYSIPRLGADVFLGNGLTVGAGAEFAWFHASGNDVTVVALNPRVGYALALDAGIAFWPRAGLSFVHEGGDADENLLALSFDLQFVFPLLPRVSATVSPTVDVGLAGTRAAVSQLGLMVGVLTSF